MVRSPDHSDPTSLSRSTVTDIARQQTTQHDPRITYMSQLWMVPVGLLPPAPTFVALPRYAPDQRVWRWRACWQLR